MILGTTVLYDTVGSSKAFLVGDVKRSILPEILGETVAALLNSNFSGKALEKAYDDFYIAFLAMAAT